MQATASGSQPRRAPAAAPAGPAGQEGPIVVDGSEDEETEELEFLGSFATSIVGIQYYTGEVGANELVGLVREPHNPYDANAIRVENIRGEKVGHVPRQVAAQLAALIDRGDLEIEGVMPSHGRNKYKLPMEVYCYGPSVDILPTLAKRLRACDCLLQSGSGSIPGADSSGAYGYGHGSPSGRGGARYGGAAAPTATERVMTHKQLESALDNMFEELLAKRGPPTAQPHAAAAPEVTTRLLPHQTAALAWMIQRENGGGLPPFWWLGGARCTSAPSPTPPRRSGRSPSEAASWPMRWGWARR